MPELPATPSVMEGEIDAIWRKLDELRKVQSSSRNTVLLLTIFLVVISIVFLVLMYRKLESNFSPEAVQQAVTEAAPLVLPEAAMRLMNAGASLVPEYRTKAMERLTKVAPEVAADARKRLAAVPTEMSTALTPLVQKTVDDVFAKVSPDVESKITGLTDQQKTELLRDFHEQLTKDVTDRAATLAQEETDRLNESLGKFDTHAAPGETTDDLQRQFLHNLIMQMDYELTGATDEPSEPGDAIGMLRRHKGAASMPAAK
jgi:hypothetical protein